MARVKKEILNERRKTVLVRLVHEYIISGNPVSSISLVEKYDMGASPATIRNDLAYLEEHGYLIQPHLSSGRIPTALGFEEYIKSAVNSLMLSEEEKRNIEDVFEAALQTEENLYKVAATAVSRITSYYGVSVCSQQESTTVKHFDIIPLNERKVIALAVLEDGNIQKATVEFDIPVDQETLEYTVRSIREHIIDRNIEEIIEMSTLTSPVFHNNLAAAYVYNRVLSRLKETIRENRTDLAVFYGEPDEESQSEMLNPFIAAKLLNLFMQSNEVKNIARKALEEGNLVVQFSDVSNQPPLITVVVSPYRASRFEGAVGLIGPSRMNYFRAIGATRYIARKLIELSECM